MGWAILNLMAMIVGSVLVFLGGLFDLIAAIGVNRFPDLYTRLHAVTIGTIGGAVYPIIGSTLLISSLNMPIAMKLSFVLPMILTAALILITAPTGSHIIARAAFRSGLKPYTVEGDEEC